MMEIFEFIHLIEISRLVEISDAQLFLNGSAKALRSSFRFCDNLQLLYVVCEYQFWFWKGNSQENRRFCTQKYGCDVQ